MQGVKETGDNEQHGNAKPEDPVRKKIFGKGGKIERFPRDGEGLQIADLQVIPVYEDQEEHGNKRPEFEFPAIGIRYGAVKLGKPGWFHQGWMIDRFVLKFNATLQIYCKASELPKNG